MSFGERLLEALSSAKLSQVDFATKMDVTKATVNDWVKGRRPMAVDSLRRAAKILGVDVETIASWVHESLLEDLGVTKPTKRSK